MSVCHMMKKFIGVYQGEFLWILSSTIMIYTLHLHAGVFV